MTHNSLQILKAGDVGVIDGITATSGAAKRLADMGFVRGARLEMVRPGSPCIVRLAGICVGLGRGHQARIKINLARDFARPGFDGSPIQV